MLSACGGSAIGPVRFRNDEIVWRVNDRNDVPKKPEERVYVRTLYHTDGYVIRRLTRAMEFQAKRRAQNVNALDEVPDSSWFTNRIGVRDMSLDEIRRGPNAPDGPETHRPWTVTGGKVGGTAVGFVIKDAAGTKYLLKFDDKRGPELETAADIIGQRLIWACGYNVPEDWVVYFRREDLQIAPDATKKDVFGNKQPLTVADLEAGLAKVDVGPDGTYRGLTSKYLDGIPIGPYSREGVRKDDPNDRIPHELRREVRGAYAIFEWLNHTDLQEDNTLDTWKEDPDRPGRHYVAHHFIDFGKALGVMGFLNKWNWVGYAYRVDFEFALKSLFGLGLWKRPYEGISSPPIPGVGLLEVDKYDPGSWRANSLYWPFEDKDRFDAFWGAKILIRFTRDQIAAAIGEARLTDPRAERYLTDVLVARQRKTARHWFRQVNPLDRFELSADGSSLCFDDLSARYELEDVGGTVYRAHAYDHQGAPTGWSTETSLAPDGRTCLHDLQPSSSKDGYLIVRIETRRRNGALPATSIHLAKDPAAGKLRVIGLWRE
jgi:hypothetical protein